MMGVPGHLAIRPGAPSAASAPSAAEAGAGFGASEVDEPVEGRRKQSATLFQSIIYGLPLLYIFTCWLIVLLEPH